MIDTQQEKLDRAHNILSELKEAGYSNKDLNELSLLVLIDMGLSHVSVEDINPCQKSTS